MRQNLGQHFLKDKNALAMIAEAAGLAYGDTVIEIGSGHGELTTYLKNQSANWRTKCKIIGIEKDPELAEALKEKYKGEENIEIVEGDVRTMLPEVIRAHGLGDRGYVLVGNIPYYLTGYLFRIVGSLPEKPKRCVFTIQKEVALRITAEPPRMNLLAASVRYWGVPRIAGVIGKGGFSPPPKVDSAAIVIESRPAEEQETATLEEEYYALIKTLFAQPRKTVWNNLRDTPLGSPLSRGGIIKTQTASDDLREHLHAIGIALSARPQDLALSTIKKIRGIVYNKADG